MNPSVRAAETLSMGDTRACAELLQFKNLGYTKAFM